MKTFDNITNIVKDDLQKSILPNSRLSIAAACFSIYAYEELKKQLEQIDELRFIFTSPTFIKEKAPKEHREFYIPRTNRERNIYGTEFEVKLRNELTQKAIARECADWIRRKATFRSNVTSANMGGFMNIQSKEEISTYMPLTGFTTIDIGCEKGNNIYNLVNKFEAPFCQAYIELFESIWNSTDKLQDVTEEVIDTITAAYKENSPDFIYFITLYNIFNTFLSDVSQDVLPNDSVGFKESKIWNLLYDFQKDAVLAIINKLEKYNGCILADSVGLGKTFTALSVIKYYEARNKSVLVLCPKKLMDNWNTYKGNYINNPIAADRLRYDVLFHTDLSRQTGKSNGLDLELINWGNYDLVVIDESHNFRNGGEISGEDGSKENRYLRLMNRVIRAGVQTKVLMLSATPVNNRFYDLKNQLALAYEGNSEQISQKLGIKNTIEEVFRQAQKAFNFWSKLPQKEQTTQTLLKMLDFDFFQILDSVTIARSRKHIQKYYNTAEIGKFPNRLKPISKRPALTDMHNVMSLNEIYARLNELNLKIYSPSEFIFKSKLAKYTDIDEKHLTREGREQGIRKLMSINLLKRLESSVYSFQLTLKRIQSLIFSTLNEIEKYKSSASSGVFEGVSLEAENDLDFDDQNNDFWVGKKTKIDLADMDYESWAKELKYDANILVELISEVEKITPQHDTKLQELISLIDEKQKTPINLGNKKVIIFTAFADTAQYLFEHLSPYILKKYGLHSALVTGSADAKTTIPKFKNDLNGVLTCFSPISKGRDILIPQNAPDIDILIATDCISEGQNLQDCDYLVNYDIHWNPVRIIQRFGRIDRIGSKNDCIQLVNFWPDMTLDEYIHLKGRVESRMKISVMTSTGDDDLLNAEEKGDLEYRRQQLKRLQEEVVDIEDMSSGISIMDLGLNEFRLDLLDYIKTNGEPQRVPFGMNAIVSSNADCPSGVIFVLKNINESVNIDGQNRLHPFYLIYLTDEGEVLYDHLSPKEILDKMRFLCKGQIEALPELYRAFNRETKDGRDMKKYSSLLNDAVAAILHTKEQSDIDSLFKSGGTSALLSHVSGLDDFELICFLVVR